MEIFKSKEFGEVKVIVLNNKEYFDAVLCAKNLGYINPYDAVRRHCKKEGVIFKNENIIIAKKRDGSYAKKEVSKKYIDESNLYRLIIKSKLKNAKRFEKWIFEEVIPKIRKHGAYFTDEALYEVLDNPNFLKTLLCKLEQEKTKNFNVSKQVESLKLNIINNNSYVKFSKTVGEANGAITIGAFAKLLNNNNNIKIGRNRLYSWFRENGYLIKAGNEKNNPKQRYIENGFFKIIEKLIETENGQKLCTTPLITGKGQLYFLDLIEKKCLVEMDNNKNSYSDNKNYENNNSFSENNNSFGLRDKYDYVILNERNI